jgi:hypothetical protein
LRIDQSRYNTFGELAKDYFDNMVACFQHYGCVVDVFNCYEKKDSTKSAERERRSSSNPGKVCIDQSSWKIAVAMDQQDMPKPFLR